MFIRFISIYFLNLLVLLFSADLRAGAESHCHRELTRAPIKISAQARETAEALKSGMLETKGLLDKGIKPNLLAIFEIIHNGGYLSLPELQEALPSVQVARLLRSGDFISYPNLNSEALPSLLHPGQRLNPSVALFTASPGLKERSTQVNSIWTQRFGWGIAKTFDIVNEAWEVAALASATRALSKTGWNEKEILRLLPNFLDAGPILLDLLLKPKRDFYAYSSLAEFNRVVPAAKKYVKMREQLLELGWIEETQIPQEKASRYYRVPAARLTIEGQKFLTAFLKSIAKSMNSDQDEHSSGVSEK